MVGNKGKEQKRVMDMKVKKRNQLSCFIYLLDQVSFGKEEGEQGKRAKLSAA